ncbi:uncharacterized protein LOC120331640 isoform X2 [Styela clava]
MFSSDFKEQQMLMQSEKSLLNLFARIQTWIIVLHLTICLYTSVYAAQYVVASRNVKALTNFRITCMLCVCLICGRQPNRRKNRCLRITERCENCSDHSLCSNCSSIDMSKRMEDVEKSVQKNSSSISEIQLNLIKREFWERCLQDYSVGVNKLLQVVAVILNSMILIYLIHWLKENATYHWMITLFFLLICCAPTKTHIEDRQPPLEIRRANIVRRRRRY